MKGGFDNPGCREFFEALIDGRLKLGQTITQDDLGEVLGLTLSRVRDVVVLLESEGLVEPRKRVGLTIFYPDVHFVGNTFQFRGILEREGLTRLAETVSDAWLETMFREHAEIISLIQSGSDAKTYAGPIRDLERRFHESFVDALGNERISMNNRRNAQMIYLIRLLNPESVGPRNLVISMEEHLDILNALVKRDAGEATDALDRHLKGALHRILIH